LPEELAEVQKLARDFADKEIAPAAAQDDRKYAFRKGLVVKMGELGSYGEESKCPAERQNQVNRTSRRLLPCSR
jgi:hypothetical protein